MASNLLTIDQITNESLMILHQKLNFVTNIVTEYDDSYAKEGAKIGNTLRIRLPMMYNTGTGATMTTGTGADSLQNQVSLTVNTQRHVPMRFTSNELTMKIDEFRTRHIEPAMAKMAAMVENDAFSLIDDVANTIVAGTAVNFADIQDARVKMGNELSPADKRCALLDLQANADMVTELKGLFQDSKEISKQYKEGMMGRTGGYDFFENTILPSHTTGAEGGGSAYLTNGANQVGSYTSPNSMSLIVDTGTKTIKKGDVFTVGVNAVHPETKVDTGSLRQFTVLADATGAGTLTVSPAAIATGPYQNVSSTIGDGSTLTFAGAASTTYKQSLLFQKGFAVFGTADLVTPPHTESSRQVYDGISMRMVHNAYDVVKDRLYTRIDVLSGIKALRPGLACKVWHT